MEPTATEYASITAYRYRGTDFAPTDIVMWLKKLGVYPRSWIARGNPEAALDQLATYMGIDRYDCASFTDAQFPIPLWSD